MKFFFSETARDKLTENKMKTFFNWNYKSWAGLKEFLSLTNYQVFLFFCFSSKVTEWKFDWKTFCCRSKQVLRLFSVWWKKLEKKHEIKKLNFLTLISCSCFHDLWNLRAIVSCCRDGYSCGGGCFSSGCDDCWRLKTKRNLENCDKNLVQKKVQETLKVSQRWEEEEEEEQTSIYWISSCHRVYNLIK